MGYNKRQSNVNKRKKKTRIINYCCDVMISIEKMLENSGLIELKNGRYVQTGDNCFYVAKSLAEAHGFRSPGFKNNLRDAVFENRAKDLGWRPNGPLLTDIKSDACLVIRTPDNASQLHVTFEYNGKEFNYGTDFPIERRLFLQTFG